MSFSFASQDSLSPWHHIVELASVFLSVSLRLSSFLVELLSLMNGVVTETHTAGPAYHVWQLTDCPHSPLQHFGCRCSSPSNWAQFWPGYKSPLHRQTSVKTFKSLGSGK